MLCNVYLDQVISYILTGSYHVMMAMNLNYIKMILFFCWKERVANNAEYPTENMNYNQAIK